jgi:hypothetical protein
MEYLYWTFECKTPDCNNVVAFQYGGIYDPKKPRFFTSPSDKPMNLFCPKCEQLHDYGGNDIQPDISPIEPSPEFLRDSQKRV